ncbi:hypothetical protein PG997_010908 [Apiospora hydei]|uniref:Uncharacterized protein n=1 Tax=Apiospora hydei TaxID=1337664 RepID=A0ABR1VHJ5_9PEZI
MPTTKPAAHLDNRMLTRQRNAEAASAVSLELEIEQLELRCQSLQELATCAVDRLQAMNRAGLFSSATDKVYYPHAILRTLDVVINPILMKNRLDVNRDSYLTGRADLCLESKILDYDRETLKHVEDWVNIPGRQDPAALLNAPPHLKEYLQKSKGAAGFYLPMSLVVWAIIFGQLISIAMLWYCLASAHWRL